MTNPTNDSGSEQNGSNARLPGGWLRLAAVAAASALAGGLAAAWWHRKTLDKLQESDNQGGNPKFRISEGNSHDDL